jgi:hypothetical protein
VVFDGILAFAGDDDDVLDARSDAFFNYVLNLRLVDDGEHLFWLRFGGRQKTGAEPRGGEDGFADFLAVARGGVSSCRVRRAGKVVGHRLSWCTLREWTPFFDAGAKQSMELRLNGARWVSQVPVPESCQVGAQHAAPLQQRTHVLQGFELGFVLALFSRREIRVGDGRKFCESWGLNLRAMRRRLR